MQHPQGLSARASKALLVGLILLLPVILASGGVSEVGIGNPTNPNQPSACDAIIAEYPQVNSTMFREVCSEASFQAAFDALGVANFAYGSGGGGGYNYSIFWQFEWVAPCTNLTVAGTNCTHQEYWVGNPETGEVSGPYTTQQPVICFCGVILVPSPQSPPTSPLFAIVVLLSGAVIGIGIALGHARKPRLPSGSTS